MPASARETAGLGIEPPAAHLQPGTLLAVPLFHVTGLHAHLPGQLPPQRKLVAMYRWDAEAGRCLIDQHRLTSVIGAGGHHR
jgi:long-chain acyl-CoA synthetase